MYPGPKQAGPDGERLRLKNKYFFDENLKYCMNCKRCEVACPSGVKIADLIHSARRRFSTATPGLRDRLLASTDFMGRMARPFAPVVNFMVASKPVKAVMDATLHIDSHRTFPKYKAHGFESWFKKEAQEAQKAYSKQIAFFHGCSTEFQQPEVGKAFVTVMNAVGYGVQLMDEKCCGVAMISNGMWNGATKHAKHNVAEFEKAVAAGLPIVATSSTCVFTMRDEYPDVLSVDNSAVRDSITLVEKFLFELVDSGKVKLVFKDDYRARIAYHIPCHVEKLGWSIFTKALMNMIPGVSFTVLDSGICHLSTQPTPWHRAGSPRLPVYLVLQALTSYPCGVTDARRELLPRVFTLACRQAVVFCYDAIRLLPSGLSPAGCPVLSGLSSPGTEIPQRGRSSHLLFCKSTKKTS